MRAIVCRRAYVERVRAEREAEESKQMQPQSMLPELERAAEPDKAKETEAGSVEPAQQKAEQSAPGQLSEDLSDIFGAWYMFRARHSRPSSAWACNGSAASCTAVSALQDHCGGHERGCRLGRAAHEAEAGSSALSDPAQAKSCFRTFTYELGGAARLA